MVILTREQATHPIIQTYLRRHPVEVEIAVSGEDYVRADSRNLEQVLYTIYRDFTERGSRRISDIGSAEEYNAYYGRPTQPPTPTPWHIDFSDSWCEEKEEVPVPKANYREVPPL